MLEGKAVIGETDMLQTMQQDALDLAAKALDFFDATDATEIARFIKQEFDRMYGPGVRLVVINVQQPFGIAPNMCIHTRCQRLAATIVEEELELAAIFVEEKPL